MSYLWHQTEKWKSMCNENSCPICQNEPSSKDLVTIAETNVSWIEATPNVALRGTCYVLSKKHAVELFDLSEEDAFDFLKDVMRTARVLKETTKAEKINYEIHGNIIPHLHLHLFPRHIETDRFKDGPIDPRVTDPPAYAEGEFTQFVEEMKHTLSTVLP
jgi:diadenosine tetraphosphate (Ap4A) HIT family hydrolase